tara:strand:+ start:27 stop:1247 length:1221 start_codon:yes stop_codon:yes gene_type:complete
MNANTMKSNFFAMLMGLIIATTCGCDNTLGPRLKILDDVIQSAVETNQIPGAVLLTTREGKVILHRAYGFADPLTQVPMQPNTLFRICSQTKAITATAAMVCWEKGLLGLDDPVAKYIPAFESIGILDSLMADSTFTSTPAENALTIRHLMTHTSGIPYGEIGDPRYEKLYTKHDVTDLFPRDMRSTLDNAERIGQLALAHEPGSQWTYSLGLDVLVAVIEVASAQPYTEFVESEIFEPLGMDDTYFVVPESDQSRVANVMERTPDGSSWQTHQHPDYTIEYPMHAEWPLCSGGAGLTSSASDYAKFLQMYLGRGATDEVRILEEATVDSIMTDNTRGILSGPWEQGLAFGVKSDAPGAGRFFWSGYFNTQYYADPATQEVVVLMKQTYGLDADTTSTAFNALLWN